MAHFAQLDENNVVVNVVVADPDFVASGEMGDPASFVQTSYNTRGGIHFGQDGEPDGGNALRKNFAGIGFTFDQNRDAFIPPKPYSSWVLNEDSCLWEAPVPRPNDGLKYDWDEATTSWVEVNP